MNATSWGDAENASISIHPIFNSSQNDPHSMFYDQELQFSDIGILLSDQGQQNISAQTFEAVDFDGINQDLFTLISIVVVNAISTIGFLLNAYILIVIIITRQSSSASSVLLSHLGVVGVAASSVALGGMPSTGVGCITRGLLLTILHPLQLWTVCGLHADKCAAIAAPLHYAAIVSPKKAWACIGIGWMASLMLIAPLSTSYPSIKYSNSLTSCVPHCGEGFHAIAYCITYTALAVFVPTLLVFLCSMKILRIARHHRHRIAAAIYEVTISAQVTVTHQRNPFSPPSSPPRRKSSSNAIVQPLGSLILFYFPFYITLIWTAVARPPFILGLVANVLISAAPVVNCILYGVRSNALKKALKNYWRKRLTKSEITQEIQARTPSACGSRRPSLSVGSNGSRAAVGRRLSDAGVPRSIDLPASRTNSCNTLRSPTEGIERLRVRNSAIPVLRVEPHIVLSRALGLDGPPSAVKKKRSPRITVTRALSDERNISERRTLCRQQSRSSGALLECDDSHKECGEDQMLLSWHQSNEMQSN